MKIKWKFEEEDKATDEFGNLRSYYKDSEPWKKHNSRPYFFLQIIKVLFALVICGIVVVLAFSYQGYDWNESGLRFIRDIVIQKLGITR
jgi:hypothetical protein